MFDLIYNSIQIKRKLDDKESNNDININEQGIETLSVNHKREQPPQILPPGFQKRITTNGKPYYTDGFSYYINRQDLHEEIEHVFQQGLEDFITRMGFERHNYT